MNREQKIAEIREKHSTGHYNYNFEIRDANQFLLDELDRMDAKYESLIEVLKEIVADLGDRWKQADERWDREADMYAQGEAAAYDYAEYRLIEVLKRVGVTTE